MLEAASQQLLGMISFFFALDAFCGEEVEDGEVPLVVGGIQDRREVGLTAALGNLEEDLDGFRTDRGVVETGEQKLRDAEI